MTSLVPTIAFASLTVIALAGAGQEKVDYAIEGRVVAVSPAKDPRQTPDPLIRWVVELLPDEKSRKTIDPDDGVFRVYVHSLARSFQKDEQELKGATVIVNCSEKPKAAYFGKFEFKFIEAAEK